MCSGDIFIFISFDCFRYDFILAVMMIIINSLSLYVEKKFDYLLNLCMRKRNTVRLISVSYFDKKNIKAFYYVLLIVVFFVLLFVINSFRHIWTAFFCYSNTSVEIYIRQILFLRNISQFIVTVVAVAVMRFKKSQSANLANCFKQITCSIISICVIKQ